VDKTRRERYPEVSVGVDTRNDSSNGDWKQTEVMLSFSLPFFNRSRYRADIARDEARHKAAEFDVADMELAVREEVYGLIVKIDAARREALLYRDEIIPRSEQALAASQSAWQNGSGMFLDVLEARRMLLEARLMSTRAVTEQWQMLSELVLAQLCARGGQLIGATRALVLQSQNLRERTAAAAITRVRGGLHLLNPGQILFTNGRRLARERGADERFGEVAAERLEFRVAAGNFHIQLRARHATHRGGLAPEREFLFDAPKCVALVHLHHAHHGVVLGKHVADLGHRILPGADGSDGAGGGVGAGVGGGEGGVIGAQFLGELVDELGR